MAANNVEKLFITGGTGFLGGAVLEKVLNGHLNMELLLLVRADDLQSGLNRILNNMRKFCLSEEVLKKLTIDHILLGDLGNPDTFLDDPRIEQVTYVINCAAVTSFGNNPFIQKVNIEGTLAFAKRMEQVVGLQRFLHVGTAMSCTPQPGALVTESAEFHKNAQHLVEYTRTKSTVEQRMRELCPDLPLLIARPSIVVGHTVHGCLPSTSIFWVFRMGLMMQMFMCSMDDRIDVVPVDYCADALLMLLKSSFPSGDIVHISAGDESVTFGAIDEAIARALGELPISNRYSQVNYETLAMMRHKLKDIFGPSCNERLMLKAMRLYGAFSMLNVRFCNNKLLSTGISKPPRFTDYISRCVQTTKGLSIPQQMAVDFK
nr:SDR family oxidoreductase [Escherichia coli]